MTKRSDERRDLELASVRVPSIASGAIASGALAIGALAVGALAIGRLTVRCAEAQKLHLGQVEIDELTVKRLHVIETMPDNAESATQ